MVPLQDSLPPPHLRSCVRRLSAEIPTSCGAVEAARPSSGVGGSCRGFARCGRILGRPEEGFYEFPRVSWACFLSDFPTLLPFILPFSLFPEEAHPLTHTGVGGSFCFIWLGGRLFILQSLIARGCLNGGMLIYLMPLLSRRFGSGGGQKPISSLGKDSERVDFLLMGWFRLVGNFRPLHLMPLRIPPA